MQLNPELEFFCKNMKIPLNQQNIEFIKDSARVNAETFSVRNSVWSQAFDQTRYQIPVATNQVHMIRKNTAQSRSTAVTPEIYQSPRNKELLTMCVIPTRGSELLVLGGTEMAEVIHVTHDALVKKHLKLLVLRFVSLVQFYPASNVLLLAQPKYSVALLRVSVDTRVSFREYFTFSVNDITFNHFNSIFVVEELAKNRLIVSMATLHSTLGVCCNVDYFVVEERRGFTDMFFFRSAHLSDITCIVGRPNHLQILLGDAAGFVSKHVILPGSKYSCESVLPPVRCMDTRVYMMTVGLRGKFLFAGDDHGAVRVLQFESLLHVRTVSIAPRLVKCFFLRTTEHDLKKIVFPPKKS